MAQENNELVKHLIRKCKKILSHFPRAVHWLSFMKEQINDQNATHKEYKLLQCLLGGTKLSVCKLTVAISSTETN